MFKFNDGKGQDYFYHSVSKITSVVDLKQGFHYILVQEKNRIVIWQAANDESEFLPTEHWPMTEVNSDLTDYYKRSLDRNFDSMQKKLLHL